VYGDHPDQIVAVHCDDVRILVMELIYELIGPGVAVLRDLADKRLVIQAMDLRELGVGLGSLEEEPAQLQQDRITIPFRGGRGRYAAVHLPPIP
jgi:hypothetical protein